MLENSQDATRSFTVKEAVVPNVTGAEEQCASTMLFGQLSPLCV